MMHRNNIWLRRNLLGNLTLPTLLRGLLLFLCISAGILSSVPETANTKSQTADAKPGFRSEVIALGVEHLQITRGSKSADTTTGPWSINMLRIDLGRARLRMLHAMDEAVGLETVSSMAARYGALAAVNSGYFRTTGTHRGDSAGVGVLNGRLWSEPYNARAAMGLIERNGKQEVIFGHLKFEGHVVTGASVGGHGRLARATRKMRVAQPKHVISGLNRPRGENELIVFTPEFHRTTLTDPGGLEIIVRRGRVVQVSDLVGSSVIPADGFVISVSGTTREWARTNLRRGTQVSLNLNLSPLAAEQTGSWKQATSIVGGGPQLIRNGRVEITNTAEKILPSFVSNLHPRTAIARLKSGQILLVTVDGRQPGVSVGMSLVMLADLLLEFGAIEAINLDGGGSTAMVIKNKLVNKPSDASGERPVSDAILIHPR